MATVTKKETTAAAETNKDTEKKVKIFIPRFKPDEPDEFVSVNERTWIVKKGVEVEVPECVAIAIRDRDMLIQERFDRMASLSNK